MIIIQTEKKERMDASTLNAITNGLTLYVPFLISILANIRSLFNFLTFQSKVLRRNSCGSYFIMWSIRDIFLINFGLIWNSQMIIWELIFIIHPSSIWNKLRKRRCIDPTGKNNCQTN